MTEQYFSAMKHLIPSKEGIKLHLGFVSSSITWPSFDALVMAILALRGAKDDAKMSLYGFIPSRFRAHLHPNKPWQGINTWRTAAGEIDAISCLVVDVDNERDRTKVDWTSVQSTGLEAFGYDSSSGTATNPRFRAVIETDRHMNRIEVRKLMAVMNKHLFNQQLDMSMADRAHYAIAPDWRAREFYSFGPPVSVDTWLARCDQEVAQGCPYLGIAAYSRAVLPPPQGRTVPQNPRMVDCTVAATNPQVVDWVCADDILEYVATVRGHWIAMFTILQRAFKRSGGVMTYGDMHLIATHIDRAANNYFTTKYGDSGLQSRIIDAMRETTITTSFGKQRL